MSTKKISLDQTRTVAGNSRRYFLAQGAGLGFAGLLQGCGGDTASDAEAVAATGRSFTPLSSPLSVAAAGASPAMGAEFLQSVIYAGFHGRNDFDPYAALAANGVRWARTLVTTRSCPELDTVPVSRWGSTFGWKNEFWSCREMGAEVMRRAKAVGMKLQLGFYLSDEAAHAGTQKRPAAWSGLSDSQLAVKVGQYARETAAYFKSAGLAIDVFELGNETDFGLCGYQLSDTILVPSGVDPLNTPSWMSQNVWSKYIPLLKAAIEGLREVYPSARFALHLAGFGYDRHPDLPTIFFRSMADAGVAYDIAGFSYPYILTGSRAVPQPFYAHPVFLGAIDAARALGKEVQILEFTYPAAREGIDTTLAHLPCTEAGQAQFISEMTKAVAGRVDRVNYWSADHFPGINGPGGLPEYFASFALFASPTTPRAAIAAIRRAAADRVFDWAQVRYPNLFPGVAASIESEQYYYRYYLASGTYLGLDQNTGAVVLHNGREWILTPVGNIADFASKAG